VKSGLFTDLVQILLGINQQATGRSLLIPSDGAVTSGTS